MKKVQLNFKCLKKEPFKIYLKFLETIFYKTNTQFSKISIPTKKTRITLLKSPHVNKKAREQFEIFAYKKTIQFFINPLLLKYIIINKPSFINITIKILGE